MTVDPVTDEARWLALLPQAVLVVHDGVVAYANRAARRLFDPVAQRDLVGELAIRLFPSAAIDSTGRPGCRLNGNRFAASLTSDATTFNGEPAVLHMVRDIDHELALQQRLDTKRRLLLALSGRMISFQEEERRHIARELHDEIGQCLSAIRVQFAKLQRRVEQPDALALIDSATSITERTLGRVRSLSLLLHPPQLETLGLVAALRWHLQEQQRLHGLTIHFNDETAASAAPPPDVAIAVYRIVQEALSNTLRHARAGQVTVTLSRTADALKVSISDDGIGFAAEAMDARAGVMPTLGLLSMAERARLLGGELTVNSAPGLGTQIAASLPLPAAPNNDKASCDPGR